MDLTDQDSNVEPDESLFTKKQLEICRDAIEELRHMTATESRDWSHDFLGWRDTSDGEEILNESVFLWKKRAVTIDDILWAAETASNLEPAGSSALNLEPAGSAA